MYSHRITRKTTSNHTSAPKTNPLAPRGFGEDTPQQSQPAQTQEELDAAYEEAKKHKRNLTDIPVFPPGKEPPLHIIHYYVYKQDIINGKTA